MSTFSDYKQYQAKKPEYAPWKEQREQNLANKVDYVKSNPINKDEFNKDVERAKIVLNAVNIMDEYSQSRAEEMEQVSESVVSMAAEPVALASMGLAALSMKLLKIDLNSISDAINGNFKQLKKLIPVAIIYLAPSLLFSVFGSIWAAKNEIKASREGRQESMETDLASVKQFALLDENQQKQVEQIAKGIDVSDKDSKKIIQKENKLGIIEAVKTIFKSDNSEKYQANVQKNKDTLTQQQILDAKKDKELIQTIVEKIDIASQDYAEDTENAIGIFETILTSGGILTGLLATFITGKIKSLAKYKNTIGMALGAGISLASIIYGAKIQKQASRVARFKAKQELLNNPEQLVYVDEQKYKDGNAPVNKEEKPSFIKNISRIIEDNKEYNQYIKENNAQNIKISQAKEQIELTEQQEKRARQLQQNVFNMFNKLDEKSQRYSESAEAVGAVSQTIASFVIMLPSLVASIVGLAFSKSKKAKIIAALGYVASLLVPISINFMITKDQKNASRVANMEAINELNDYRYFASSDTIDENNGNKTELITSNQAAKTSPMLQKMLKK